MVQVIWNYLKGYVIIKISGFSVERFLNLMADRDVFIWNVCSYGGGTIMKIRQSGMADAEKCAAKTGCTIKVIECRGLPFALKKFSKRRILISGVVAFVVLFYGLSFFIWTVEISGNVRIMTEDITAACDDAGLSPGSLKMKIEPERIAENIVDSIDEVAWASVEISGTKAYVRIVEKIKETEIADRKTPVDIIADNDGVILSIAASSGTPKVKEGDVVSKGDLLISSEIEIKENEEIKGYDYVAAGGSVVAKVVYPITSFISLNIKEKIYTGESFKDTAVIFGNNTSNIFKPDIEGKYYDSFVSDDIRLKIGDYELPLGIKIYDYRVYYENERKLTEAEAEERLKEDIIKITEDMTEVSSLVLDVKEEYIREGDGIRLNAYVTVSEDIAVKDYNIRRSTLGGIEGKIAGDR